MQIIYTKSGYSHYTDSTERQGDYLIFSTVTQNGKTVKHTLAYDQIAEIADMPETTVEQYREEKKSK